jgi:hypothetical protein
MGEYNGNSFDMGRMWGRIETHIEHQTDILLNISEKLDNLPSQISTAIASGNPSTHGTVSILKTIPPILKALVPILTIVGLMTGKIAWSDIPNLLGH